MNTKASTTAVEATQIGAISAPEQLTLLTPTSVPLQFRLDERTRRSGLQHVAALRLQIAAQIATRPLPVGRATTADPQRSAPQQIAA